MSDQPADDRAEDPAARIFRAAIPGRPGNVGDGQPRIAVLFAPGRGALEASVILSALTLLVPVCCVGAVGFATVARRAGNRRWLAALVAGVWCGVLGLALRAVLGMGVVP